jgi:flagellin-like protein
MRGWRTSRASGERGIAELVGALMLVLIVVAASVTFAFYIASEEQQQLAERTALHLKNLENVTVQTIDINPVGANASIGRNVTLVLSSSDIYNVSITDIALGGNPAKSYCIDPGCNYTNPSDLANFSNFPVVGGNDTQYLTLVPFSVTAVTINDSQFYLQPFTLSPHGITVTLGTVRGNEFVESLVPPVPRIGLQFIDNYPLLDGSASFQPHGGSFPNASINAWTWKVQNVALGPINDTGNYIGEQVQMRLTFSPGALYNITLTVTNTLGLNATTVETYQVPG